MANTALTYGIFNILTIKLVSCGVLEFSSLFFWTKVFRISSVRIHTSSIFTHLYIWLEKNSIPLVKRNAPCWTIEKKSSELWICFDLWTLFTKLLCIIRLFVTKKLRVYIFFLFRVTRTVVARAEKNILVLIFIIDVFSFRRERETFAHSFGIKCFYFLLRPTFGCHRC